MSHLAEFTDTTLQSIEQGIADREQQQLHRESMWHHAERAMLRVEEKGVGITTTNAEESPLGGVDQLVHLTTPFVTLDNGTEGAIRRTSIVHQPSKKLNTERFSIIVKTDSGEEVPYAVAKHYGKIDITDAPEAYDSKLDDEVILVTRKIKSTLLAKLWGPGKIVL